MRGLRADLQVNGNTNLGGKLALGAGGAVLDVEEHRAHAPTDLGEAFRVDGAGGPAFGGDGGEKDAGFGYSLDEGR